MYRFVNSISRFHLFIQLVSTLFNLIWPERGVKLSIDWPMSDVLASLVSFCSYSAALVNRGLKRSWAPDTGPRLTFPSMGKLEENPCLVLTRFRIIILTCVCVNVMTIKKTYIYIYCTKPLEEINRKLQEELQWRISVPHLSFTLDFAHKINYSSFFSLRVGNW